MRSVFCTLLFCFTPASRLLAGQPDPQIINFEEDQGLLWIEVQTPQSDRPLHFLFDTGASVSVINADTAAVLGLAGGNEISVKGVNTTTAGHWPIYLSAKSVNLTLPSKYLSLDLSRLALACGRPLDGLLGADFIQGRVVDINFQTHQLRILSCSSPAQNDLVLPLKRRNDCYAVAATINNQKRQWLRLDTGCASPLQWVDEGDNLSDKAASPGIGLASCLIQRTETTVYLGDRKYDHVSTGIHHHAIFAGESGLLGTGMLTRFTSVTIDGKNLRLILSLR